MCVFKSNRSDTTRHSDQELNIVYKHHVISESNKLLWILKFPRYFHILSYHPIVFAPFCFPPNY